MLDFLKKQNEELALISEDEDISYKILRKTVLYLSKKFKRGSINIVICTNYAKTLIVTEFDNLTKAGLNIIKGSNLNEIGVIPKKIKKIGFFEKLFHIFS